MILRDEPEAVYHSRAEVSNSRLSKMAKSPLSYWAHYVAPEPLPQESTDALNRGVALHTLVLEPHNFEHRIMAIPDKVRKDKRAAAYQAILEEAGDRIIMKDKEVADVRGMADAVRNHDKARELIDGAEYKECTVLWEDEPTGLACRGRIDMLSVSGEYLADLKSTRDATLPAFRKSIYNYGYDRQVAMYKDGLAAQESEALAKVADFPCLWICVEPTPPYHVAVYGDADGNSPLGQACWEDVGRARYRVLIDRLKVCLDTDTWPGLSDGIELITPPDWAIQHLIGTPVGGAL